MWHGWQKNALLVWLLLTLVWGALTILLDALVLWLEGVEFTISWQLQRVGRANPVVPFGLTFLCWGLMWHFFRLRDVPLVSRDNTIWYAIAGGLMAIAAVELTWTQRGPQ